MQQLFSFRGRATRLQWWAVWLVVMVLGTQLDHIDDNGAPLWILLCGVACAASLLWIGLAVSARRWHDTGRTGWLSMLLFVPVLGLLIAVVFNGLIRGNTGDNRYGPPPL